jgi:CarD family transcriptional regulator
VTLPLVATQDFGASRLPIDAPGDHPVQPLATNEVLDRMTSAHAPAPAIVEARETEIEAPEAAIAEVPAYVAPAYDAPEPAVSADDLRPFRKGDLVVYPAHGIGMVDHVRVEEIGGQKLNWIKISFAENRMSLRIPVRKAKDIGLRRPVTRQAFAEVMAILRGRPHANRIVWTKRALEYQGKINSGCVRALAEVVRDLRPSLDGSESSFSRRNLFEMAVDRLAAEFAAVFRTDKAAAIGRLTANPPAIVRLTANPPAS